MSANWNRCSNGRRWFYQTNGTVQSVPCDESGWIDIEDLKPETFHRVQAFGQLIFASTCAPKLACVDSLRSDDAGEHWGSVRNVTHWQPMPQAPRVGS